MRPTLMMVLAAVPMMAAAQVPPTAPTTPSPAAPAPAPAPKRVRGTMSSPKSDWDFDYKYDLKYDLKIDTREMQLMVEDAARMAKEVAFMDFERVKFSESKPRKGWSSEDPADSLYRVARETLIRGEYRRAAQMFNDIAKKYPRSEYVASCQYWEAFARYRSGTTDDLKQALRILDEGKVTLASLQTNRDAQVDVPSLRARIQSALAARGDPEAAERVRQEASEQSSCDPEEMAVKAEALSALGQMDAAAALPIVKKVLARRDECTRELRRRALYVVGRQTGPEASTIIFDVARNDSDPNIRGEAMRWLPRVGGDNAVPQLEELLRTSTDEQQQRSIISALNSVDSERARRAVRAIIERNDASERVRYEAIQTFLRERDGRQPSAEEQNYIRGLYSKLESAKLREAALYSLSRVETTENQQFLMTIVRNQNEVPSLRAAALQRLGRMESVSVNDIAKLYDIADTRSLREQVLYGLSQRKEDAAVDKMIEIAKKDTDPQIRRSAINFLARSSNKRAQDFIKEIFDR